MKCAFQKNRESSMVVYYKGVVRSKEIVDGVDKFEVYFDDGDHQWYTTGSDDDECSYSQNNAKIHSSNELYRMLRLFNEITWENKLWADVESKLVERINIPRLPLSKEVTAEFMKCLSSGAHHNDINLKRQLLCILDDFSNLFMSRWKNTCRTKQNCGVQVTGNRLLRWSTHTQCRIRELNTVFHLYHRASA